MGQESIDGEPDEELFPLDKTTLHARLPALLCTRWRELIHDETPLGRRARTLGTSAALIETRRLAELNLRAESEELQKSQGERMLPDVSAEAKSLLVLDRNLKRRPELKAAIESCLPTGADSTHALSKQEISRFRSLISAVETQYLELAEETLTGHFGASGSLIEFEIALEQLASHARCIGWSDQALLDKWRAIESMSSDPVEQLKALCSGLAQSPQRYRCSIEVALNDHSSTLSFQFPAHGVSIELDSNEKRRLCVEVLARDSWAAATEAATRAAAVVGAPNVFQHTPNSTIGAVRVEGPDRTAEISVEASIKRDHHNPRKEQIEQIVAVASRGDGLRQDTLYDAIRNHQRALQAVDIESAYALLWSALERLCVDIRRPEPVLRNTADLVPPAMAFTKIRREVQHLAEALTSFHEGKGSLGRVQMHTVDERVLREKRNVVSYQSVLAALVGAPSDARDFCASFYEDVRLVQWFVRLRREMVGSSGTASLRETVPEMIRASQQRTRWQVLRLYRARNHLAHGATRTQWLADLARHANYFLTNIVAICLNYVQGVDDSARDVLLRRSSWLDAYLDLAKRGDTSALAIEALLKPSRLFERG